MRVAWAEVPPNEAVIVTVWLELTAPTETVKVADVVPAPTVTVAGTDALLELEERATTAPPGGAAAERVAVPVTDPPPATEDVESARF